MKQSLIKNESGFSMVQVMVAIGLSGVLSLVIMKNMEMQSKSQKTVQLQTNVNEMRRLMQDFVSRGDPCRASFQGATRGGQISALNQQDKFDGVAFAEPGKEFQKSGIQIVSMSLQTLKEQITDTPGDTGTISETGIGIVNLIVRLKKIRNDGPSGPTFFGGQDQVIKVPIVAEFNRNFGGAGNSRTNAYAGWKDQVDLTQAAEDAALSADGLNPVAYRIQHLEPVDSDYARLDPANPGGPVRLNLGAAHPNFSIVDCGSQLSFQN